MSQLQLNLMLASSTVSHRFHNCENSSYCPDWQLEQEDSYNCDRVEGNEKNLSPALIKPKTVNPNSPNKTQREDGHLIKSVPSYLERLNALCSITANKNQDKCSVIEQKLIVIEQDLIPDCSITDNPKKNKDTVIEQNKNTVIEHSNVPDSSITENLQPLVKIRKRRNRVIEQGSGCISVYLKRDYEYYRYSYRDSKGKLHHKHLGPVHSSKTRDRASLIRRAISNKMTWEDILMNYIDF